jgi:hypothetical protein
MFSIDYKFGQNEMMFNKNYVFAVFIKLVYAQQQ